MSRILDFDGDAVQLVRDAYSQANEVQDSLNTQSERDWLLYLAYTDPSQLNPDLPNTNIPKLYSLVEIKAAIESNALFGMRPFIPFDAVRDEFREAAQIQTTFLDALLNKAGMYDSGSLITKIKILYGTSFANVIPYYEKVLERKYMPDPNTGALTLVRTEAYRLRLKIETWAPWEIMVDPFAQNLTQPDGCRYIIKVQLCSKRMIRVMYEKGAYPDLDLDKLNARTQSGTQYNGQHFGRRMLQAYGLPTPEGDDDIGVLLRYESPDRHVHSWMGDVALKDIDNPFEHGLINLSKMVHVVPPHPQYQFWGIGEAKPSEMLINMLNDYWTAALTNLAVQGQPSVFYRKGAIEMDDIIFGPGTRIPVESELDRPISQDVQVHGGIPLTRDHYMIPEAIERAVDLTSGSFGPSRGEELGGQTTATEVSITTERGDTRQESTIRHAENTFKADFGMKASSILEQFSNMEDLVEVVGEEDALKTISANPADLPGGYNFDFKGSARISQLLTKQRNMRELAPMLMSSMAARPGGAEKKLLELHDFSEREIKEVLFTEDELLQQQQMQMMMTMMGGGQEEGGGKVPGRQPRSTNSDSQVRKKAMANRFNN